MKHVRASHAKGDTNGERAKNINKSKCSNAFLRYVLCFVTLVMFLPLIYLHLNVATTTIQIGPQPTITIKKNLEGFQGKEISHNGPAAVTNNHVEVKKRTIAIASPVNHKNDHNAKNENLVLTAYLEPPETLIEKEASDHPLIRNTSMSRLRSVAFPNTNNCSTLMQNFPVDNFPLEDPFLPWIHDYFPSIDGKLLRFVAQNRRKCDTGVDNVETMKFWAPQVSLFQGIPVVEEQIATTEKTTQTGSAINKTTTYRLASSFQEATHNATRFQCRFHHGSITMTTLSVFPFDYEFINWRKGMKSMIVAHGEKDKAMFWLSQLLFACPIPEEFQSLLSSSTIESSKNEANDDQPALYVDLIPIRTPVRWNYLLPYDKTDIKDVETTSDRTSLQQLFGRNHVLPPMDDAGRWQNLPICRRSDNSLLSPGKNGREQKLDQQVPTIVTGQEKEKPYRLVACTWTSSSYHRRGDEDSVSDSAQRLREWIQFHLMVGVDHVYVYDNTDIVGNRNSSDIHDITRSFGQERVTYNSWKCKICNNVRCILS